MSLFKISKKQERSSIRLREAKDAVHTETDRKGTFTFRGTKFNVHRLKDGTYVVMTAGDGWRPSRIVKNLSKKLLNKAKQSFAMLDCEEVMGQ